MFQRYAIYYTPDGALAARGAEWLGWSIARGEGVAQPEISDLDVAHLTRTPKRYGMHGTIKPPFHLASGRTFEELLDEFDALCGRLKRITTDGLEVKTMGGFIALTPTGNTRPLAALAAEVVMQLDGFRAPPNEAELARRRRARLSSEQEKNLTTWGYPYVLEEFRFHITLTGRVKNRISDTTEALQHHFEQYLPRPFVMDSLTLAGEDAIGRFHEIRRLELLR